VLLQYLIDEVRLIVAFVFNEELEGIGMEMIHIIGTGGLLEVGSDIWFDASCASIAVLTAMSKAAKVCDNRVSSSTYARISKRSTRIYMRL
jgi:hypothetical protein